MQNIVTRIFYRVSFLKFEIIVRILSELLEQQLTLRDDTKKAD